MYEALAGRHAVALTLEDFGLLSMPRPADRKQTARQTKAKPAQTPRIVTAIRKLRKPR